MSMPTIRHVRAFTVRGGGADYHDQGGGHWIDDHIATPMSRYPEYRQSRQSFGINVLGTLVVEIEASDGTVGFAVTTGGEIGAWIVEKHFARFVEGNEPDMEIIEVRPPRHEPDDVAIFELAFAGQKSGTRNDTHRKSPLAEALL